MSFVDRLCGTDEIDFMIDRAPVVSESFCILDGVALGSDSCQSSEVIKMNCRADGRCVFNEVISLLL